MRTSNSDVLLKLIGKVEQDVTNDDEEHADQVAVDDYVNKVEEPFSSGLPASLGFWPTNSQIEGTNNMGNRISLPYNEKTSSSKNRGSSRKKSGRQSAMAQKLA